jgi:glycerate 2-kinase
MAHGTAIPTRTLLACAGLSRRLPASTVAEAIAAGLLEGGAPEPDLCPLPAGAERGEAALQALHELGFDERMRAARAVLLAVPGLGERGLAGSIGFEIATRARQSGVPCYAVLAELPSDPFDARIMDLQVVLEARSRASLHKAGNTLAGLI